MSRACGSPDITRSSSASAERVRHPRRDVLNAVINRRNARGTDARLLVIAGPPLDAWLESR